MAPEPSKYDPAWLERIRPLAIRDVPAVAAMHARSMGTTLWGRLGEGFLAEIYRAMLLDPDFLGYVYEEEGKVRGFIAGTQDGRAMMRRIFRSCGMRLAFAAIKGALRSPSVIPPLLLTPWYFRRSRPDPAREIPAESLFCCFDEDLRGKRVSGLINKVLFKELRSRGHASVKITTESDNEGAVRQLKSLGFEKRGEFRFYGKGMTIFLLNLESFDL